MKHVLTTLLILCVLPASAQDTTEGERLFHFHCATCHGLDATGNGPMAPALTVQPANLTELAATNDGDFPILRVIWRIDGRDPLVSHGSSMPIFGDFFEGLDVAWQTETGQPIMTSQPIVDLVSWLQSKQN